MTPKGVSNTILNTAMMTAFGIPGGAPVGVAIAIGMGFFDIFCPDAAVPAALRAATQSDIDDAVNELKAAFSQELFNSAVDAATRTILSNNQGLVEKIGEMKKQGVDQTYWVFPWDITTRNWLSGTVTYFTTPNGVLTDLRIARSTITLSSSNDDSLTNTQILEHRTKTTALYCLATSAILLYLKTAVSWQWSLETLYTMAYPKLRAAEKVWGQKSPSFQADHSDQDPKNIFPPEVNALSSGLLDWQDWVAQRATPVDLITEEMNDIVRYAIHDDATGADGLFTLMNKNWTQRISQFDSSVTSAFQLSSAWPNVDLTPQIYSKSSTAIEVPQAMFGWAGPDGMAAQNEVLRGAAGLEQWEADTALYGLDGVTANDLAQFHSTISIWQDALQTLQFQTLTAVSGDTPGSLALRYFGDAALWNTLLDTNEKVFAAKTQDLNGVRVKIPYRAGQKVPLKGLDMKRVDLPELPFHLIFK